VSFLTSLLELGVGQ